MQRMGMVIGVKPDEIAAYKKLHANVWPDVLAKLKECNIRNYSIFLREPENLLFGYWEYIGDDFVVDAQKMANDPKTQDWWKLCGPKQQPLESKKTDEWWAEMEEVFHLD